MVPESAVDRAGRGAHAGIVRRVVNRVLVVEDNKALLRTLQAAMSARFPEVRACRTVAEARVHVTGWTPDLVVLDFMLPDGDARAVLDLTELREPAPVVVAVSGEAGPTESFELAQRGVRAFLPKPLTLDEPTRDRSSLANRLHKNIAGAVRILFHKQSKVGDQHKTGRAIVPTPVVLLLRSGRRGHLLTDPVGIVRW